MTLTVPTVFVHTTFSMAPFVTLVVQIWRDDGSQAVNLFAAYDGAGWVNVFLRNTQTFRVGNVPVNVYDDAQIATGLQEDILYLADTPQAQALVNLVKLSEAEVINMQSVGDVAFSYSVGGNLDGNYWLLPFAGWEFGSFVRFVSHSFTKVWPLLLNGRFELIGDAPTNNTDCLLSALSSSFSALTLRETYSSRKGARFPCSVDVIRSFIDKPNGCCSFNDVKPFLEFHRLGVVVYDVGARCRLNWKHFSEKRYGAATAYLLYHNRHIWPLSGNKKILVQAHLHAASVYAECESAPPRLPSSAQANDSSTIGDFPFARLLEQVAEEAKLEDLELSTSTPVLINCLEELEHAILHAVENKTSKLFARTNMQLPSLFRLLCDTWKYEPSITMSHGKLRSLHLRFNSSDNKTLWVGIDCTSNADLLGFGGDIPDIDFKRVRASVAALFPESAMSHFNSNTLLPFTHAYSNGQIRRTILTNVETQLLMEQGGAFEIDRRRAFTADLISNFSSPNCIPIFDEDAGWEEITCITPPELRPKSLYLLDASKLPIFGNTGDTAAGALQTFLLASKPYSAVWGFALQRAIAIGMLPLQAVFGVLHPSRFDSCNARRALHSIYADPTLHDGARKLAVNIVIGMTGSVERASTLAFFTTDQNEARDLSKAVQKSGGDIDSLFAIEELGGYLVSGVGRDRIYTMGYNVVQSIVHGAARLAMIEGISKLPTGNRDSWLVGVNADALLLRQNPLTLDWTSSGSTTWENLGEWSRVSERRTQRLPGLSVTPIALPDIDEFDDILPNSNQITHAYTPLQQNQHLPIFMNGIPTTMPEETDPWQLPGNVLVCGVSGSGKTYKCLGGPLTPFHGGLVVVCPTHDRRLGIETEFAISPTPTSPKRVVETTTVAALLGRAAPNSIGGWTRTPYALLPHQSVVVEEVAWLSDDDIQGLLALMDRHPTVKWVWNLDWLQNTLSPMAGPTRESQFASRISARFRYIIRLETCLRLTSPADRLLHANLRAQFLAAMSSLSNDIPINWPQLISSLANVFQFRDNIGNVQNKIMITSNNLSSFVWSETIRGTGVLLPGEKLVYRARSQLQNGLINHRSYLYVDGAGKHVRVQTGNGYATAPRHCFRFSHAITGHLSQGSTYAFPYFVYAADLLTIGNTLARDVSRDASLLSFLYTALTRATCFANVELYVGSSISTTLSSILGSDEGRESFKICNGVCLACEIPFHCTNPDSMILVKGGWNHVKCLN